MVSLKNLALLFAGLLPFAAAGPVEPRQDVSILDVSDKYIVILKDEVDDEGAESHMSWINGVHKRSLESRQTGFPGVERTYRFGGFHGYAGKFDSATLEEIRNNPEVGPSPLIPPYIPSPEPPINCVKILSKDINKKNRSPRSRRTKSSSSSP